MNYKEYSEQAISTAIYPGKGNNIIYPVLGLVGETGEVCEKFFITANADELLKELGDVFWYVNAICYEVDIDFNKVVIDRLCVNGIGITKKWLMQLSICVAKIAEKTKKLIRDGNGAVTDDYKKFIEEQIGAVVSTLIVICDNSNVNVDDVLQKNIDKLFSRKERGKLQGSGDNR